MRSQISARAVAAAALLLAGTPLPGNAITPCKAKSNTSNGVIQVEGKDVLGTPFRAPQSGKSLKEG